MTIQELFTPRRRTELTGQTFAAQLGWPPAAVAYWAAHDAGIRESAGWDRRTIDYLVFLRMTESRWR